MNNNSRKIRIITIIMLLSLLTTLFSACAASAVSADYFTAEMPTVESVVGYNVESTTTETESIDSVVKLSNNTYASWSVAAAAAGGTDYVLDELGKTLTIYTAVGLAYFANQVNTGLNAYLDYEVTLANSINLTDAGVTGYDESTIMADGYSEGNSWTAIGELGATFKGTFDGGDNTISGLYINTSSYCQGLFGYFSGTVENLNVSGSVTSTDESSGQIGGVVGYNYKGTVSNCTFDGTVSGYRVGGIVGVNSGGTITNCTSSATVTTLMDYAGGIVGYSSNSGSKISNCTFAGKVYGDQHVGGIAGENDSNSIITNCVNEGTISGTDYVGGIVGISQASSATVINCYNTGNVTGTGNNIGGIVGNHDSGKVYNCYNTGDVTGASYVGGLVGANGSYGTVTNCYAYDGITVTKNGSEIVSSEDTFLIGSDTSTTTSNVTTFNSSGNLDTTGSYSYESCTTLLSALNAYVKADNGANNLSTWYDGYVYGVGEASAVFEKVDTSVVTPTESQTETLTVEESSSSSNRTPLDQYAPTITVDGDVVTIYDQNLVSITINGEEIEITDSTMIIDLSEYGNGEHEIVATDKYRRETTMATTVSIVEEEAETPTATTAPTPTETPTATVAPTETIETESNQATNNGYAVWIILGAIAIGVIGVVIYKKKK